MIWKWKDCGWWVTHSIKHVFCCLWQCMSFYNSWFLIRGNTFSSGINSWNLLTWIYIVYECLHCGWHWACFRPIAMYVVIHIYSFHDKRRVVCNSIISNPVIYSPLVSTWICMVSECYDCGWHEILQQCMGNLHGFSHKSFSHEFKFFWISSPLVSKFTDIRFAFYQKPWGVKTNFTNQNKFR